MTARPAGPGHRVQTSPDATDPRLRGRRYAIPFERVWQGARRLASGGLRRWILTWEDDRAGVIEARIPGRAFRPEGIVQVRVFLDAEGQTGVQLRAGPTANGGDRGASRRRVIAFLDALDRSLALAPGERLPPYLPPR